MSGKITGTIELLAAAQGLDVYVQSLPSLVWTSNETRQLLYEAETMRVYPGYCCKVFTWISTVSMFIVCSIQQVQNGLKVNQSC